MTEHTAENDAGVRRYRRHPAEITADRMTDAYERYFDKFTGNDLINMEGIIAALREIAEGER